MNDKMDLVKDDVSKVIIETRNILVDFKKEIKLQQDKLPNIAAIKKQLDSIKGEIHEIKKFDKNIRDLFEDFEDYLKEQQEALETNNIILVSGNKDQLIALIDENLPDGMGIRKLRDTKDTWKIIYSIAKKENPSKREKKEKIPFYRKEEKVIGEMMLVEYQDDLILKVKIGDEVNYHELRIDNSLKIYPIISHINTKYNYKEEKALKP
jgi:hypothetical protein